MNLRILLAASALIVAVPALAHDVAKGLHGGPVAEAGSYHVELVARDDLVDVFLTDASDKPLSPVGILGNINAYADDACRACAGANV